MSSTIYRALAVPTSSFEPNELFFIFEALGFDFFGRNETIYNTDKKESFCQKQTNSLFEEAKNQHGYIILFQGGGNDRIMAFDFDDYAIIRIECFTIIRYPAIYQIEVREKHFDQIQLTDILWLQGKDQEVKKPTTTRGKVLVTWLLNYFKKSKSN